MNRLQQIRLGATFLMRKRSGKIKPVAALWELDAPTGSPSPDTDAALTRLDKLADSGVRLVIFSGLRKESRPDMATLIRFARQRGMVTAIDTYGDTIGQHLEALEQTDRVRFFVEGAKEYHDAIHGNGAYDRLLGAIEVLLVRGVDVGLRSIVTTENVDHLSDTIAVGRRYDAPILFDPAPGTDQTARMETYRFLEKTKAAGDPVANSPEGLALLFEQHPNNAAENSLLIRISHDGAITTEDRDECARSVEFALLRAITLTDVKKYI